MDSTFWLLIFAMCALMLATIPTYKRFHENREKEQRKPEKYHLI